MGVDQIKGATSVRQLTLGILGSRRGTGRSAAIEQRTPVSSPEQRGRSGNGGGCRSKREGGERKEAQDSLASTRSGWRHGFSQQDRQTAASACLCEPIHPIEANSRLTKIPCSFRLSIETSVLPPRPKAQAPRSLYHIS